ncbi:GIN domain-containing protein [Spirosoma fluviale]|uniref:Putative auto-transporter adhesin head GIN domain-containing protein n=1 Tax=Spirosoma fluviale TaxID=1597977 RepID=A0A286GRT6_9BACT|nr:DUF2807 domain-containing protein [Spirosoma fluviale]SOD97769.1 hypothetical protein SAMN06269250_5915 [Spirosoma fluviale]
MKHFLLLATCLLSLGAMAQRGKNDPNQELRGSGRPVRQTTSVKPFDALEIHQFPAAVTVEVGGAEPSVDITLDDNLLSLLRADNQNGKLNLSFEDPQGRAFWISKANIEVRIITPTLKKLTHGSNSNVTVNGLQGESFALINQANGNVTLTGKVNSLDVISWANGTVNADALPVQSAKVVTQANATIRVNAQRVNGVNQAFATVINVANRPLTSATNDGSEATARLKLINVRFENNSPLLRTITLISYAPGEEVNETNGFTLLPYADREKQFPVGTTVYVATNQQVEQVMRGGRLRGKPFLTVSPSDEGRKVKLVQ